jgi:hypothetical protein
MIPAHHPPACKFTTPESLSCAVPSACGPQHLHCALLHNVVPVPESVTFGYDLCSCLNINNAVGRRAPLPRSSVSVI